VALASLTNTVWCGGWFICCGLNWGGKRRHSPHHKQDRVVEVEGWGGETNTQAWYAHGISRKAHGEPRKEEKKKKNRKRGVLQFWYSLGVWVAGRPTPNPPRVLFCVWGTRKAEGRGGKTS